MGVLLDKAGEPCAWHKQDARGIPDLTFAGSEDVPGASAMGFKGSNPWLGSKESLEVIENRPLVFWSSKSAFMRDHVQWYHCYEQIDNR